MTTIYKHTLTPIEEACGVTLEQVADLMAKVLVRQEKVYIPESASPALAGSVARCVFGGQEVDFLGSNALGHWVYAALGGRA